MKIRCDMHLFLHVWYFKYLPFQLSVTHSTVLFQLWISVMTCFLTSGLRWSYCICQFTPFLSACHADNSVCGVESLRRSLSSGRIKIQVSHSGWRYFSFFCRDMCTGMLLMYQLCNANVESIIRFPTSDSFFANLNVKDSSNYLFSRYYHAKFITVTMFMGRECCKHIVRYFVKYKIYISVTFSCFQCISLLHSLNI